jgi:hypothetical protein
MALVLKSVRFFVFLFVAATACPAATIGGRVIDAETGATIPATITIHASDGTIVTENRSFLAGFRSSGTFEKQVPTGETTIVVSDDAQVAFTNPVWFEPRGWQPPQPARAHVGVTVVDSSGKALDGDCEIVRMVGKQAVVESQTRFHAGKLSLDVPGTARIRIRVPGYQTATESILMDYAPLRDLTLYMRPEDLTDWRTFEKTRDRLRQVSLEFRMER